MIMPSMAVSQTIQYEMLVSSRNNHSVKRYNAQNGEFIDDFIVSGAGGLNTTQDLIIGPEGNILVSGRGNTQILLFDKSTGDFIMPFTSGYNLNNPTKISLGPDGNLYVSQWGSGNTSILRFNGMNGQFIDEYIHNLNLPLGHTWDAEGNMYIACYGSKDVRKFDSAGNFLSIFTQEGYLQGPTNLWFDGIGNLMVIDWVLGKVQKFSSENGSFTGTLVSGLQNAEGYSYGPDSNLYVCDWSQNNVKKYSSNGIFVSVFTIGGNLMAPNSILIRPSKVISVGEISTEFSEYFELKQNYPNPFNTMTRLNFNLPKTQNIKLEIFSITGKLLAKIINNKLKAGSYEFNWEAENFPSGIYYYKLSNDNQSDTKKMVLIK